MNFNTDYLWMQFSVDPREGPPTEMAESEKQQAILRLKGKTVLLVEDNLDSQEFMSRMLMNFGLNVRVASNGLEAITHVSMYEPDLILMDLRMPVIDGFDATRRLRLDGFTGPIIATTAEPESTHRHECLDNGFTDFVTKPVTKAALIASITTHMKMSKKTIH